MKSSITFLGTGGDSYVVGRQLRKSGGFVVRVDGVQLVVDPGPGCLLMAKNAGVNIRETTAIISTHSHTNHSCETNALISGMTYNGVDINGVLVGSESVVKGVSNSPAVLTPFHKNCLEKALVLRDSQKIAIEDVEIHGTIAFHDDESTAGFMLLSSQFVLGYTSDTSWHRDLASQYKNADILIINVPYPNNEKGKHGLNISEASKLIEKAKPALAIITHFGKKMLLEDPLSQARIIQRETGIQVLAAQDGQEILPDAYAAHLRQKTLNLYKQSKLDASSFSEDSR